MNRIAKIFEDDDDSEEEIKISKANTSMAPKVNASSISFKNLKTFSAKKEILDADQKEDQLSQVFKFKKEVKPFNPPIVNKKRKLEETTLN
jgi:hypothetical protein